MTIIINKTTIIKIEINKTKILKKNFKHTSSHSSHLHFAVILKDIIDFRGKKWT
jgi:hypothetical protein